MESKFNSQRDLCFEIMALDPFQENNVLMAEQWGLSPSACFAIGGYPTGEMGRAMWLADVQSEVK